MKLILNLASRTYINRRLLHILYGICAVVLLLVMGLNVVSLVRSQERIDHLDGRLGELDREISRQQEAGTADYSPEALTRLRSRVVAANELLRQNAFRWTELLGQLEQVVPDQVSISRIEPDYESGTLDLSGVARDVAELKRFLDNLIASPHFAKVYLLQQARSGKRAAGNAGEAGVGFAVTVNEAF